uniref:5'-nucleotidase domain-containing protein 1 n=1 Tax=Leptobrachium leishanense TaxID=445787 RepID=A0A8C5PMN4_9ANUR
MERSGNGSILNPLMEHMPVQLNTTFTTTILISPALSYAPKLLIQYKWLMDRKPMISGKMWFLQWNITTKPQHLKKPPAHHSNSKNCIPELLCHIPHMQQGILENCGTYFPAVKKDPSKYLKPCPDSVKNWIRSLKNAGKVLLLITSSHSDYCRLLCEHILGKDFEELFDVIITNALKPGFFSLTPQQRPFWTLENDVEKDVMPLLEKAGWYSQGNWKQLYDLLNNITGKSEPKVVYFGDSMRSDIFSARLYSNWETVLVLEELEGDEVHEPDVTDLGSSLKKKGKYDSLQPQEPYFISSKWGSYFADTITEGKDAQETPAITWSCASIKNYSTITIPSIKAIVDLSLDYMFTRFSSNNSDTDGYYPQPPKILLPQNKEGAAA